MGLILAIVLVVCVNSLAFAQNPGLVNSDNPNMAENEEDLPPLKQQARLYRNQGLAFQGFGDLDKAMALFQKAKELDPGYPVVLNDLGVVYEARGFHERAKESFLSAISVDPYYLSAYSNLALLYEKERDLKQAAVYWKKRAELGFAYDAWTEKARRRLDDINLVLSGAPPEAIGDSTPVNFQQDIYYRRLTGQQDDIPLSRMLFKRAKLSYQDRDYAAAMKNALDAQYLDPANTEIEEFIEKIQKKALSK